MKASVPFDETSRELLNDPETAAMYLEEFLEDEDFEKLPVASKHTIDVQRFALHPSVESRCRNQIVERHR